MNRTSIIVIPAYNEDSTISKVVKNCKQYGDVLVINDGSADSTALLAKASGAKVITNKKNFGYEYSLNIGHSYALKNRYKIMITFDADGELPHTSIPLFIKLVETGKAMVLGKRLKIQRITESILAKISFLISGIADPYCGMKAYDLQAIKQKNFSQYNSVGTALAFDYVAQRLHFVNVEIKTKKRKGQSKFGGIFLSEFSLISSLLIGVFRLFLIWLYQVYFKVINTKIN